MAEHTKSRHRVLYVPDQVSKEVYKSFLKEPMIKEVLTMIKSANMVLHGIGDAITMAERRKTSEADYQKIIDGQAVGESFGYYFNEEGEVVQYTKEVIFVNRGIVLVTFHQSKASAIWNSSFIMLQYRVEGPVDNETRYRL